MGSTKTNTLCKYWLHGACRRGADCTFAHTLDAPSVEVCTFYLQGNCAYGDRCRYQHKRPEWAAKGRAPPPAAAPPPQPRPAADSLADQLPISQLRLSGAAATASGLPLPVRLPSDPFLGGVSEAEEEEEGGGPGQQQEYWYGGDAAEGDASWSAQHGEEGWVQQQGEEGWVQAGEEEDWGQQEGEEGLGQQHGQEGWGGQPSTAAAAAGSSPQLAPWELPQGLQFGASAQHPELRSLCMQWFSTGACSKGDACKLVHGDLCEHCGKHALHPTDTAARAQHLADCRLRHERLASRARSNGIECGICLEPVLSKLNPGDRKFGLLSGCSHAFCLGCIRNWRQKTDGGADLDTALRTCPICRSTSHYVVPSTVWPAEDEEKERIVAGYHAKLHGIDCKWFACGEGTCPFGTSCFYRHAYPDGRLEDGTLRKAAADEGVLKILQPPRLSDFIELSVAGRQLASGRRRR